MIEEYPSGAPLSLVRARVEMRHGKILITGDKKERAMYYKGQFLCWSVEGKLENILSFLFDFSGWYVQERNDGRCQEIVTKDNTDISKLNKSFLK
jgi:hypothetical protein